MISQQQSQMKNAAFRSNFPELPELDNLFAPEGVIKNAKTLAENFQTIDLRNNTTINQVAAFKHNTS